MIFITYGKNLNALIEKPRFVKASLISSSDTVALKNCKQNPIIYFKNNKVCTEFIFINYYTKRYFFKKLLTEC